MKLTGKHQGKHGGDRKSCKRKNRDDELVVVDIDIDDYDDDDDDFDDGGGDGDGDGDGNDDDGQGGDGGNGDGNDGNGDGCDDVVYDGGNGDGGDRGGIYVDEDVDDDDRLDDIALDLYESETSGVMDGPVLGLDDVNAVVMIDESLRPKIERFPCSSFLTLFLHALFQHFLHSLLDPYLIGYLQIRFILRPQPINNNVSMMFSSTIEMFK